MSWWVWLLIALAVVAFLVIVGLVLYSVLRPKKETLNLYDVPTAELLDEFRSAPIIAPARVYRPEEFRLLNDDETII